MKNKILLSEADAAANEQFIAVDIKWAVANIGFGHLTFTYDKAQETWTVDTEGMPPEFCKAIVDKCLDDLFIKK